MDFSFRPNNFDEVALSSRANQNQFTLHDLRTSCGRLGNPSLTWGFNNDKDKISRFVQGSFCPSKPHLFSFPDGNQTVMFWDLRKASKRLEDHDLVFSKKNQLVQSRFTSSGDLLLLGTGGDIGYVKLV
jgi:hypothetical protein